ncbi:Kinase [Hexamita inflata]|uniref:non-specific serine/threonine protein kinase n=1 Tax=Hexamita inflata TaxID=28002 RepID=A0AA86PTH7_9EUKA|nr:Kinase [Hexamita inflata]
MYKQLKYLHQGSQGQTILSTQNNILYVIKILRNQTKSSELQILQLLNHPNIIKLHESFVQQRQLHLVFEYANNGSLQEYIQTNCVDIDLIYQLSLQITNGLQYIHKLGIIHRDVKPDNILVHKLDDKIVFKLADFGVSKMDEQAQTLTGTPYYLSPQICKAEQYGSKTDIWALGVVLYVMTTNEFPFSGGFLDLTKNICTGKYPGIKDRPEWLVTLISMCLQVQECKRPSADEILQYLLQIEQKQKEDVIFDVQEVEVYEQTERCITPPPIEIKNCPKTKKYPKELEAYYWAQYLSANK